MQINLSTVTPVYQGENFLKQLVDELATLRRQLESSRSPISLVESVFVVDDAVDESLSVLKSLEIEHPWVRSIQLSANFGQHPATMAGILYCTGDWIVTLDEDLQHHPETILKLLRKAVTGNADIVYASSSRPTHKAYRNFASRCFKKFVGALLLNPNIELFSSFRLIRGDIARSAAAVAMRITYFDIALGWFTKRVATLSIPLEDPQKAGVSRDSYSISKLLQHSLRLIISSEIHLLRLGTTIGAVTFLTSSLVSIIVLCMKLIYPETINLQGWTSLFLLILFFGGLITLMLGVALEFVANIYTQSQGKPTFFVVDRSLDDSLLRWFEDQ